jgi:DnaK suppressor protein
VEIEKYRQRLLELERQLTGRTNRAADEGRDQLIDYPHDAGDASVAAEAASEAFTAAELDSTTLEQVRAALGRIDGGTFGRCVVDGKPIEEKRLEAMPWTPYCLQHQAQMEASGNPTPPSA